MSNPKRNKAILELEEQRGKNLDLFLLKKIIETDDKVDKVFDEIQTQLNKHFKEITEALETISKQEGPKGEKGDIGERGERGEKGIAGERGEKGENGIDGVDGKDGKNGIDGKNGKDGRNGRDGKDGKDGEDGKSGRSISFFGGRQGISYYDISASLNGSTKTFWIPTNMGIIAVIGSSFPFIFRPVTDYIESGHNIEFTAEITASISLAAGQTITVLIKRNS